MNVSAIRTMDIKTIHNIVTRPDIWATVAEDGQRKQEFYPDVEGECWLTLVADDTIIGVYNLHVHNAITLEIHAHVYPEFRKRYSRHTCLAVFQWIMDNAKEYQKVVASIPAIYPNVIAFAEMMRFKHEGTNRLSYLKDGQIVDQELYGITRTEIEEALNVQDH